MENEPIRTHVFNFSPAENSGESLVLTTKFIPNGDLHGVFMNQELVLHSYCNNAMLELSGITLTPPMLKQLADELENELTAAKALV